MRRSGVGYPKTFNGDWGEAVLLAFRYTQPRTGADVEIPQAVRGPRDLTFDLRSAHG